MALLYTRTAKFFGWSVNSLTSYCVNYGGTRTDCLKFARRLIDARSFCDQDSDDGNGNTKRKSSSSTSAFGSRDSEISSNLILLQDGLHIRELPVLVKKTTDIPGWTDLTEGNTKTVEVDSLSSENKQNEELNKVIQLHLRQVATVSEVLQYLLVIPTKDVTPLVALSVLERIIELQNDATDEGQTRKTPLVESNTIMTLCNVVCRSTNSNLLMSGLETVIKIRLHFPEEEKKKYIDIFVRECLQRIHSGKLSLIHICWFVENLFNAGSHFQAITDTVWSEIVAQQAQISPENINRVFALLLYLKSSRKVVLGMLESHVKELHPKLHQKQIIHMLHILCLLKLHSNKLLDIFSSWTRLNVHKLTESGLRDIVMLMNSVHYTSPAIETAIERFVKMKGSKCKDTLLMTALAEKIRIFRWRSPIILESVSKFFVQNVGSLTTDMWGGMVQVFGYLNYEPSNAYQLFQTLETVLSDKIPEIEADTVISILLSCVYIQRYPLNFVKKLFSPGFLDRLNFQAGTDEVRRQGAYNNLKLLDTAMHLECPTYTGPYLPRNLMAKSLVRDSRLPRIQNRIRGPLSHLLGGPDFFQMGVVLPKLPLNHLYIVDVMIHLDKNGKPQPYHMVSGIYKKIAVVLLLPEHFCKSEEGSSILTGPQAMRMRHLNLIGLTVASLEVSDLERLSSKRIFEYLETKLGLSLQNCNKEN